jgi:polysaccharide export outer membrane protein
VLVLRKRIPHLFLALAATLVSAASAQQALPPGAPQAPAGQPAPSNDIRPNYVLGPNDQMIIRAFEVDELNDKPFKVDENGMLNLPLLGRVKAAGLTVQELEADLVNRLKMYVLRPQVIITMTGYRSEIVSFVGAFQRAGIFELRGRRTLIEMLSSIGGLQPNAARRIKITRAIDPYGPIPLPNAVTSADGKFSTVEISMGSLTENINPVEDILLQPFDKITAERAEQVYVSGEVGKVGAFELGERESYSVLQIITMAGGLTKDADAERVKILRPIMNTDRRAEITLDLTKVMAGKASDYPLLPNDVLVVPRNKGRILWSRVALYALPILPTFIFLAFR